MHRQQIYKKFAIDGVYATFACNPICGSVGYRTTGHFKLLFDAHSVFPMIEFSNKIEILRCHGHCSHGQKVFFEKEFESLSISSPTEFQGGRNGLDIFPCPSHSTQT